MQKGRLSYETIVLFYPPVNLGLKFIHGLGSETGEVVIIAHAGGSLLLKGTPLDVIWTIITSFLGLAALAGGVENWFLRKTTFYERILLIVGGLMLVYPVAWCDVLEIILMGAVLVSQKARKGRS